MSDIDLIERAARAQAGRDAARSLVEAAQERFEGRRAPWMNEILGEYEQRADTAGTDLAHVESEVGGVRDRLAEEFQDYLRSLS